MWDVSDYTTRQVGKSIGRAREHYPSGHGADKHRICQQAIERGGSAPFNLIPRSNARGHDSAGGTGHGAGTPLSLCDWWVRYLCPPGGTVCDPFVGSGTVGIAAVKTGRNIVACERDAGYFATAEKRINAARATAPQLLAVG